MIGSTLHPKTIYPKAEFVSFYSFTLVHCVENCIEELLECVNFFFKKKDSTSVAQKQHQ